MLTLFLRAQPREPPVEPTRTEGPLREEASSAPVSVDGRPPDCLEGWGPPPVPLHGPAFRSLTPEEKSDLIRLHRNLGHPSPQKVAEHLQTAKAFPHIIAAAKDYVCDACVESTTPRHQRPSKLHDPQEFNDTVGLDTFYWRGSAGFQVHILHVIESSCFQAGKGITDHAISVFRDSWTHWAGVPKHIYIYIWILPENSDPMTSRMFCRVWGPPCS